MAFDIVINTFYQDLAWDLFNEIDSMVYSPISLVLQQEIRSFYWLTLERIKGADSITKYFFSLLNT